MVSIPERQTSKAAGWSRRTAAFSAVLLLTVFVGHHFDLVETPVFLWVLGIVALLAALALLFAAFAFSRLWKFGDRGGRDLTVGALLALKAHFIDRCSVETSLATGRAAGLQTLEAEVRCIMAGL